jgi:hypothetical protein
MGRSGNIPRMVIFDPLFLENDRLHPPAAGDTFVSNQDRGCGNLYHLPLFAL